MKLIFIHGSDSNSQTYKATLLRQHYPHVVIPDFTGPLDQRMEQLEHILGKETGWTIVGSSLGGTMATLFAARHPPQVRMLLLLAPALALIDYTRQVQKPIEVPCIIIHGTRDEIVPLQENRKIAGKLFSHLDFVVVDDDHRLHATAEKLGWENLLSE